MHPWLTLGHMYRTLAALVLTTSMAGCSAASSSGMPSASGTPSTSATAAAAAASAARAAPATDPMPGPTNFGLPPPAATGLARLEPNEGTYLGLNLDWGDDSARSAVDRLGRSPAVWVQFARFPLDDGTRTNLDAFLTQVAAVGGIALITLEPHDGLAAVTDEASEDLADYLADAWTRHGVRSLVRFAHEMNGSWYPWAQQPIAYIAAFRRVARAIHERSPASAMVWAPNHGTGYPFSGGTFEAGPGTVAIVDLDTDGDGEVTSADDPYAPYYPGDDAVDWVGMSLYHWGLDYPWGENELPRPGSFATMLRGEDTSGAPDFYATYAVGHDKPMAIVETAILFDPAATHGPPEAQLKTAWFQQVFAPSTRTEFPRIALISWFEWRKHEPEVGRVIDWRLGSDPALARSLLGGVASDWLLYGGDGGHAGSGHGPAADDVASRP